MLMKLITFFHVGHPSLSQAQEIASALLNSGTDILEFGIPFSDPVADGPVIQAASYRALVGGATPKKCLQEIAKVNVKGGNGAAKEKMILTYYNILYKYNGGVQGFVADAAKAGVNYILSADLPIEEAGKFEAACKKNGVKTVFMVAPNTTDARIA
ncbi:Tryptophan synthase alpha chain [Candidatus Gugararchaeum adminiculabundum]|nr:Tryptophan synthase alpha chain [Candidatus Gugararchaeum adminiculabundum]